MLNMFNNVFAHKYEFIRQATMDRVQNKIINIRL